MAHLRSKQSVLIVDADTETIAVLKPMLAADYHIEVAADGEEAIRLASSEDIPDVILLNVMMPATDMDEVCRKLKAEEATRDIPIILLAEPTAADAQARGFELGAADCITTPFNKYVVRARVRTHLELKRLRDNLEKTVIRQVNALHAEIRERRDVDDTYRALVEHARDGIAIIQDYQVRYANPAFLEMIGFSEKELIGAHLRKFISEEEFVKNTKRYSDRIKGLNLPRIYKSQVVHADGSTIDVELNVCVIPYGRSLAALVFVRDILEEQAWQYFI